jgi:hypothetical protein
MKIIILTASLTLFMQIFSVNGQNCLPKFVVPAPDTYSLARYGDIPIGYYTGTPDINVPLWTLKDGDISVPISLSYHASGIKVDEIASLVGLGWSLNAGGVITRVIKEEPDEPNLAGTALNKPRTDTYFSWFNNFMSGYSMFQKNQSYNTLLNDICGTGNSRDDEPDVFYYNFNGKSGKFFFDNNGIARLYKHENIQIKWMQKDTSMEYFKFIIIDEYGNSYEFDSRETTLFQNIGQKVTSWYLSKITSPKGFFISFTYQSYSTVNQERLPRLRVINATSGSASLTGSSNVIVQGLPKNELKLTQITASNGASVDFVADVLNRRLDYPSTYPTYPLKEILIKNSSSQIERIFSLNTSYFIAEIQDLSYPNLNYRLKLNSITEFSGDRSQSKLVRSFGYFGDTPSESALRLPFRLSPSQDHWGYFNGQANTHLFPGKSSGVAIYEDPVYALRMNVNTPFSGPITDGANREPDALRKKSNVLKRINYPTGGYSEFDFESHNSYGINFAGLRILKITHSNGASSLMETNYSYEGACIPVIFDEKSYFTPFNIFTETYYLNNYGPNLLNIIFNFNQDPNIDTSTLNEGTYIRVTTYPQAVLDGAESGLGYERVTEQKTGNGKTVFTYAAPGSFTSQYSDYYGLECGQPIADWYRVQTFYFCPYDNCSRVLNDGFYSTKHWPNLPIYSNEFKRSILRSMEYYLEGASTPLRTETYEYNTVNLGNIAGYNIQKIPLEGSSLFEYFVAKYYIPYNWVSLKKKIVSDYTNNGTIAQTTRYYYKNDTYKLLDKETIFTNVNDSIETRYRYPSDINVGVYSSMKNLNMLNYPIEVISIKNNNVIGSNLTTYKANGTGYVPDKVYKSEFTTPFSFNSFTYFNGTDVNKDIRYGTIPETSYDLYNTTNGNLSQGTSRNGIVTSYLWSYNQTYPVANLTNGKFASDPTLSEAAYIGFESYEKTNNNPDNDYWSIDREGQLFTTDAKVGKYAWYMTTDYGPTRKVKPYSQTGIYTFSGWAKTPSSFSGECYFVLCADGTGDAGWTAVSIGNTGGKWKYFEVTLNLGNIGSSISTISAYPWKRSGSEVTVDELRLQPTDAQMTTYTYKPLVGMTSKTDPNGITTYYEYDSFGRLKNVKDHEWNILKQTQYHYQNQP